MYWLGCRMRWVNPGFWRFIHPPLELPLLPNLTQGRGPIVAGQWGERIKLVAPFPRGNFLMMKSSSTSSSECRRNEAGAQPSCSSTSTNHQPVNNNNNNNNKQTNKQKAKEILNWRHSNSQGSPPVTPPHQQNLRTAAMQDLTGDYSRIPQGFKSPCY